MFLILGSMMLILLVAGTGMRPFSKALAWFLMFYYFFLAFYLAAR